MKNKIYVDHLAATVTEIELSELFSPYGNVMHVQIAVDPATRKSRGSGSVVMATSEGARAALEALNGKAMGTRTLSVSEVSPD